MKDCGLHGHCALVEKIVISNVSMEYIELQGWFELIVKKLFIADQIMHA